MLIESIALAIFTVSFGGILLILAHKIPVLVELPQNGSTGFGKHKIVLKTEERIKGFYLIFKKQIILHKFLSWVKCLTIKAEVKIDHILHSIRRKAQKIDKDLSEKK